MIPECKHPTGPDVRNSRVVGQFSLNYAVRIFALAQTECMSINTLLKSGACWLRWEYYRVR